MFKLFICEILKGTKYMWCIVSSVFVILTIQTVQFQGESFFWCNGSMYYTGYLSLTFYYFGAIGRYLLNNKKRYIPILILGAIFLAGGNYVSLLPTIIILGTITVLLIWKRNPKAWSAGILVMLMIVGLLISAIAPGNKVRGQGSLGSISAIKAILLSMLQSISYLEAWLNRWWLMAIIILTPIFWNSYKRIQFTFPLPLVVIGYIHGIFCSMSCPTFYAQGNTGPARAVAIIFYCFILTTWINYYYLLGYLYRWWKRCYWPMRELSNDEKRRVSTIPQIMAGGLFLLLLTLQLYSGEFKECSSVIALHSIKNGEVFLYEQEYQERLNILNDETIENIVFEPYTYPPRMLHVGDFPGEAEHPYSMAFAKYFNKESIRINYTY